MRSSEREVDVTPVKGIDLDRVIGVPYLVGRLFDLYDGLMVAPMGGSWEASRLTLQADGSIVGAKVRNEGRWGAYDYAAEEYQPLESARAFALMYPEASAGPYAAPGAGPAAPGESATPSPQGYVGMPDSIWRHTRADMPVGYLWAIPRRPPRCV